MDSDEGITSEDGELTIHIRRAAHKVRVIVRKITYKYCTFQSKVKKAPKETKTKNQYDSEVHLMREQRL